jgi:hypothetical protein
VNLKAIIDTNDIGFAVLFGVGSDAIASVGKAKFFGVCRVEMVLSDRSSAAFGSFFG